MRYKLLILFSAIIFSANTGSSAVTTAFPDTLSKPWRMSEKEFLKEFGDDDTCRALIGTWFQERYLLGGLTGLSVVAIGAAGIGLISLENRGIGHAFAALGSALLMAGGIVGFALFFTGLILQSRKRLYRLLIRYKQGNGLPRRFRRMRMARSHK